MMATAPRHLAQKTRTRPAVRHRPNLRVIKGGAATPTSKSKTKTKGVQLPKSKLRVPFLITAVTAVAIAVFGLVFLNIFVAQSSFHLQKLYSEVAREETRYRQMRYQVATAESPQKIAEAGAALGLVVPERQEYLLGPPEPVRLAQRGDETNSAGHASWKSW